MERIDSRTVYEGPIASVRIDEFRYPDGSTSSRQVVSHPGAVAVVAHDSEILHLVRQPREAVGEGSLLELPAGKLDVPGEAPIDCAKRELVEEIGHEAADWRELKRLYTSPGFAEEEVILYVATGLRRVEHEPHAEERIEIVEWPLAEIDGAIAECRDAKSLVGLLLFRAELLR
ncbi:MAG TPA: NUDIX hydrolase [Solirubrobacterales bacterium]|nr:NUDIX hydrolase [Solirubrobacterales bacterium]